MTDKLPHSRGKESSEIILLAGKELEDAPLLFFHDMSALHVLDLSSTSVNSLPQSISRLNALQKLILRGILRNLANLEEFIVEDCTKISSLVDIKYSDSKSGHFLPNLKKILLLELPKLVSISNGLCIAPKLERMVIFFCSKLIKLSTMEVSSKDLKIRLTPTIEARLKAISVAWWWKLLEDPCDRRMNCSLKRRS
ncbi:putative disease resistance protein [Camellia lanceoleosa]|uniref:Disease resistance protein n=1 Tax=Camellia lanceoleosa TaxID=1840588 RepID=A0ACC0IMN0_9ERIC|nr:putative disease resistance protein [Camellia lanceoleosa]